MPKEGAVLWQLRCTCEWATSKAQCFRLLSTGYLAAMTALTMDCSNLKVFGFVLKTSFSRTRSHSILVFQPEKRWKAQILRNGK